MQEYIKFNDKKIRQPDTGLGYDFESTYSQDSDRDMGGSGHFTPMFTVEAFSYQATGLTKAEMKEILQIVANGKSFTLHYYSPYYGEWRDAPFYVGKGSLAIGRLNEDTELFDSLSFNVIGVEPI